MAFAELARDFCVWCERAPIEDKPEHHASIWLSELHAAALSLPQAAPETDEVFPDLPESLLVQVKSNLARFNGMYYREFFDPDPLLDNEMCMGDVGDDLLDTYLDLKRGLNWFDNGSQTGAIWHWSSHHSGLVAAPKHQLC